MKDSSEPAQSTLGYLAAFTLGIICMGAIVFFTRTSTRAPSENVNGDVTELTASEPSRIHFQRTNSTASVREALELPRASARPLIPVQRPSSELPAITEAPLAESVPLEPAPLQEPEQFFPPRSAVVAVPAAAVRDAVPNGARVSGRVFLMFKPPAEKFLPLDAQCAAEFRARGTPPTTRFYVTGRDDGLADALVMITVGLPERPWPVPQQPVTLRLRGCLYENHIVGIQTGQRLLVSNLDKTMHNIHNLPERNREKSIAMMPRSAPLEYVFEQPEYFMRFKCDVHPWEFAYVTVLEHPFFTVTDANGNFAITGLPPGRYTLEAHHRKAGILRREITVEEFRNASADFHFRQPPVNPQNI